MTDWKDADKVVTTFGTIKQAQQESFVAGIMFERQRIIELLEPYANAKCDEYCSYRCECYGKYEAQEFIALIKGENK